MKDIIKPDAFRSLNKIAYYDVYPKIVRSYSTTVITVANKYVTRYERFIIDGEYYVLLSPMLEFDYEAKGATEQMPFVVKASEGKLKFEYEFEKEQDYALFIWRKSDNGDKEVLLKTFIYALDKDLYERTPLKGNTHMHSCYSDGLEEPLFHIGAALRSGMDYIAVTDHNNYEGSVNCRSFLEKLAYYGIADELMVLNGEEFSCNYQPMHIISLGADCAVPQQYYICTDGIPDFQGQEKTDWIVEKLKRLSDYVHAHGGKTVLCHPFWKPVFDWVRLDAPLSLLKAILESGSIDAVEVVGGAPKGGSVISSEQYYLVAETENKIKSRYALLGQSDSHAVFTDEVQSVFGTHYTIAFASEKTSRGILNAIEEKLTVAVDETESGCIYYGPLRLVNYCRFLEKEYFAEKKKAHSVFNTIFDLCATGKFNDAEKISKALKGISLFDFGRLKDVRD